MRLALGRLVSRFRRAERGAAAVEFAILVTPLVAILLASLQTAIIFAYDEALQSVTLKAARQLMTGTAQTAGMSQSTFQSTVCGYGVPIFYSGSGTCSLMVDVQSGSSFSAISTTPLSLTYNGQGTATNTWNYSPGNAGDIVIVRVMYNWPVIGGNLLPGLANQANGSRLLIGTAVFKNEPYQ
jgi:Flp pilus assembly protein TadG